MGSAVLTSTSQSVSACAGIGCCVFGSTFRGRQLSVYYVLMGVPGVEVPVLVET